MADKNKKPAPIIEEQRFVLPPKKYRSHYNPPLNKTVLDISVEQQKITKVEK